MRRGPVDAFRSTALGVRTRRETLRLMSGVGIGLSNLAALVGAEAASGNAPERRKQHKKRLKHDSRCKHRKALSLHGACIGDNPITRFPALCAPSCFCVANHRRSRRTCVQVGCEGQCASDADCAPGAFCANVAGCCLDHPEYERTCVTPCPRA